MVYEEYAPGPALQPAVTSFWRFELEARDGDAIEHVIPPDGTVSVAVAVAPGAPVRAVVVGPRLTALRVPVRREVRYVGIRCAPAGGAIALLGVSAADLRDRVTPLSEVAPSRADDVSGRDFTSSVSHAIATLQAIATRWLEGAAPPDPVVAAMVARVLEARGDTRVAQVCAATGVSYRQALRRFQRDVGLSPKEFARLVRLRHACLRALGELDPAWAAVSAETGFADQAHMGREFSDVFGWPPRLVREYLRRIEHVHVRP